MHYKNPSIVCGPPKPLNFARYHPLDPIPPSTIQLSFYIDQTMMKLTHSSLTPSGPIHAHQPLQKLNFFLFK